MRSIISANFCNSDDLRAFGINPILPLGLDDVNLCDGLLDEPDLSDMVDVVELNAVNKSLALHGAEVEDFVPRRSYKMSDYLPVPTKPTPPTRAMRRRLAA